MAELTGRSAGVSAREIDLTGPQNASPVGVPAGIIGTSERGPAFVPLTFATRNDFTVRFGESDGSVFGPIAVSEWLRNAQAVTFCRVLGVGKGEKRLTSGDNAGRVESAGFVVGQRLPLDSGFLGNNPYAVADGVPGRVHFLGCFMSESAGSTIFSEAGIAVRSVTGDIAVPILRGILMAPSGVVPMLESAFAGAVVSSQLEAQPAANGGPLGAITGTVETTNGAQNFTLLLNGHINTPDDPNIIVASFDQTAPNYFGNILNKDPLKIQKAGHYLYAQYDIHPTQAVVTGTGIIDPASAIAANDVAFLTTGSLTRNSGSATVPSYENFEERYTTPSSPTIISQKFGGGRQDLFRVHMLSDGRVSNSRYKISIQNIAKSNVNDQTYGTFDLLVRDWADSDNNRVVVESYSGLSLNPSDDNYIARRIGDLHLYYDFDKNVENQKLVVNGKYPNISNLIRVEMDSSVENGEVPVSALPIGFRGPHHLVTSGSNLLTSIVGTTAAAAGLTDDGQGALQRIIEPPIPYRESIAVGTGPRREVDKQLYWGVQFEQKISLAEPNLSGVPNKTLLTMTKFFPEHQTVWQNMAVGENAGTPDVAGTILDSDRFNNNLFALDHIRVKTGSNNIADAKELASAEYVRNGMVGVDDTNKTRALSVNTDFADLTVRQIAKFNFYVRGGFDGTNIFNRDTDKLTNAAIKQEMDDPARGQDEGPTVRSYQRAMQVMGNVSDVDIKLLAIPGIRHEIITNEAIKVVESDRFDSLFLMDIEERDVLNSVVTSSVQQVSVTNTVSNFGLRGLDTSFAAAYFPNVIINNPFTNLPVEVPPSVAVLGAFALNDSIAFPWFAPAGFTRGALQSTEAPAIRLNRNNLDALQDVDINPVIAFPGSSGVVVWGQKTLQATASALDRVNVRRLLIEIRRAVRSISNQIIFEPNRVETLNRFSQLVNPVLQRIQEQQGINRFRVIIDATTTTQSDIENNTIRGKIFVEPTRTIEIVSIDFVLTNAGADVA